MSQFSLYKNLLTTTPVRNINTDELYNLIQSGELKKTILKLRAEKDKKNYDRIKKTELPAVTLSGIFTHRKNDDLVKHSGLIQIDIDSDQVKSYRTLFNAIKKDQYTFICFRSPGGKGIKVIVKIKADPEKHRLHFIALEKYYLTKLKVKIDPACKDISRALLLTWDPYIFRNPGAKTFTIPDNVEIKIMTPKAFMKRNWLDTDRNRHTIENIIDQIRASKLDITTDYNDWLKIAFALADTFGEGGRNYFHTISQYHSKYDPKEADKLYSQCLKKNNHRIHFGTLVFIAKEHGIGI